MILRLILRIICGVIIFLSAFLHFIFVFVDIEGGVLYYWIFGDPESMPGLALFAAQLFGLIFAIFFSVIHAILYTIVGLLSLIFKNNKVVPSFSFIFAIISIILGVRVVFTFGYLSAYIILLMTCEIIILTLSLYSIIAPKD